MQIELNGESTTVPEEVSLLSDLILFLNLAAERLAVEVNRQVVRKKDWSATALKAGDQVEIVHFVGGG
jgi:thiamine biosynthesis protein ThiS